MVSGTLSVRVSCHRMASNDPLTTSDLFAEEARRRWGNTDAYRQSVERTKQWTKQDYEAVRAETDAATRALGDVSDLPVSDERVQELIVRHRGLISRFYDCSDEIYLGLGEMYVSDPRFTEYYDAVKPGLARFLKDAIAFSVKKGVA